MHEGGFGLRATDDGLFVFSDPAGRRIEESGTNGPRYIDAGFRGNIEAQNADLGLLIDAGTSRCGWRGERMDYGLAVEALYRHRFGDADRYPIAK